MRALYRTAVRRPGWTLAAAALVTLAALPGVPRLVLETDGRALVPQAAPEVRYDRQVRHRFGVRDPIAVVLESTHPEGLFRTSTLERVERLTESLRGIAGVREHDLLSLATERGFRFRPRSLHFRRLLEPMPRTPEELAELRDDLRRIELYDGILVSADGAGTALMLGTPPGADRRALVREIRRLAEASGPPGGAPPGGAPPDGAPPDAEAAETVRVVGAPVAEAHLGTHILADLGVPAAWLGEKRRAPGLRGRLPGMVPVAIAVMALVFLLAFRRPAAALLPLLEVGGSLAVVFGLMGWLGVPIYLTTAALPVILTAVGVADEIHIFRRYVELSRQRPEAGQRDVVRATLDEMAPPVLRTSLTTSLAFLSFAVSPLPAVRSFGLFTALGVVVCLLWSLTVVPACLVLAPARVWVAPPRGGASGGRRDGLFSALATLATRRRKALLAALGVATLLAADGARRVRVQDSWLDGFAPDSAFARATRRFEEGFLGTHLLRLTLATKPWHLTGELPEADLESHALTLPAAAAGGDGPSPADLASSQIRIFDLESPGPAAGTRRRQAPREWTTWVESVEPRDGRWHFTLMQRGGSARLWLRPRRGDTLGYELHKKAFWEPATLERVDALESFVAGLPGVGGVLGPARLVRTVSFMTRPNAEDSRALPLTPARARILWHNYGRVRGEERRAQTVDATYANGLVTVYLKRSNYLDTERLMAEIRAYAERHLLPHGLRLDFAGDVAVSQALISAVVSTQLCSLALSLLGIFAAAALFGRALRWGFLCLVPPSFAVLVSFAAMGWLGIPLGVATSMFAGMTLGVGVDFALHLLSRHRRLERAGAGRREALAGALRITGPAIVIDAAAVGLGFSVLTLSQVPANARLGALLVFAVFGCLAATLLAVPALLAGREPATEAGGVEGEPR